MGKLKKVVGAAAIVAGVAFLSKGGSNRKTKEQTKTKKQYKPSYVERVLNPSDIDDAKMVNEGAVSSIQYYNDYKEKHSK